MWCIDLTHRRGWMSEGRKKNKPKDLEYSIKRCICWPLPAFTVLMCFLYVLRHLRRNMYTKTIINSLLSGLELCTDCILLATPPRRAPVIEEGARCERRKRRKSIGGERLATRTGRQGTLCSNFQFRSFGLGASFILFKEELSRDLLDMVTQRTNIGTHGASATARVFSAGQCRVSSAANTYYTRV